MLEQCCASTKLASDKRSPIATICRARQGTWGQVFRVGMGLLAVSLRAEPTLEWIGKQHRQRHLWSSTPVHQRGGLMRRHNHRDDACREAAVRHSI